MLLIFLSQKNQPLALLTNENDDSETVEVEVPRRRSSRHSSLDSGSTILPKQCIFCKTDKYITNSRTIELLTSCIQLRADDKIRTLAKDRCDTEILAVTSDELIAKEAHYHFSCYRDYVRPTNEYQHESPDNGDGHTEEDDDLTELFECLNDLYQHPKYIELKSLQSLVKTESGKKNITRTIERNTNEFTFTKCGRNFLVYPRSWKTEDMVSELYKSQMKLLEIEKANEPETIVCQSGSIIRNEVKNMDYTMPWPPSPEDLNAIDFQIPKHLDLFLTVLLSGNLNVPSDQVDRLKLWFAQDVIYAGMFSKLSLPFVLLSLTLLRQFKQKSTWGLVFYTPRKRFSSLYILYLNFSA